MTLVRVSVILIFGLLISLFIARSVNSHLNEQDLEDEFASEIKNTLPPVDSVRIVMGSMQPVRNPLSDMKRDELNETIARPLFSPTRRPFVRPPQRVATPRRPPPSRVNKNNYKLLGILSTKGRSVALIRDLSDGKILRVRHGDHVRGWSIGEVGRSRISLKKRGEGTIVLNLFP